LEAARIAARRRWAQLFVDPYVWTVPEKRRAMLAARRVYQDVTLQLLEVLQREPRER
jgi:hypothetical protein